jgi:antitoxin VapB
MVHTIAPWSTLMTIAKVFRTGRSQAIRLPKEFRVETDQVYLKRTHDGFLVIARDPWEVFFEGIEQLSDDFMAGGRVQPELEKRA